MFGYVMANLPELSKQQKKRYGAVYCGICRAIRLRAGQMGRLGLSYDMAFLALLLMSLYEPEETGGRKACMLHPKRAWVDNEYVQYAADMNVALAYYNCLDDFEDEGKLTAKAMAGVLAKGLPEIRERYGRQCDAIEQCLQELKALEKAGCDNPDLPASCFGKLMGQLLVFQEDMWSETLYRLGMALGRYIYLADAAVDYRRDCRKKQYNPFLAMGTGLDWTRWEQYLVLAMGRCTEHYERLPLVQDKKILDNILYSGVWVEYRRRQGRKASVEENNGAGSL
ncbi:MAG: hypothetical protein J6Q92_07120 [Oscillospiraceae bacterium]|nr:hypothetical protein [Oscillospiraceae bacterium]